MPKLEPSLTGRPGETNSAEPGISDGIVTAASHVGAATAFSMVMGLAIKLMLPRFFQPADIGNLYFAESIAIMVFSLLPFGIPTYISRELPKDRERASSLLSTLLPFIVVTGLMLLAAMVVAIGYVSNDVMLGGCTLGMGLYMMSLTVQRQIVGQVYLSLGITRVIAYLDIATRTTLVVAIVAMLIGQKSIVWIAMTFAATQVLSLVVLSNHARHLGFLSDRFDLSFLRTMIRVSWPFFAVAAIVEIYGSLDIAMLRYFSNAEEVAFYGAANKLKGAGLALVPIIQASLQPALSKSWFADRALYVRLVTTSLRVLVAVSFPMMLALLMLPDVISRMVFGNAFDAALGSILILAPVLMVTYLNVLMGTCMAIQERGKVFLLVTGSSLALNALLNIFTIPFFFTHWGVGAGGIGAGLATLLSELCVLLAMKYLFHDGINFGDLVKRSLQGLAPCLLLFFYWLSPLRVGVIERIALFFLCSTGYLFLTRLVTVDDIRWVLWVKFKFDRRKQKRSN